MYHKPVMLKEAVDGLSIKPDGTYVDVTFGGGGHSKAILEQLGENGKLYAFDRDKAAAENTINDERFTLIEADFKFLRNYLKIYGAVPFDGLLADLGVSSRQFDDAPRGFSTRFDAELDMRMTQTSPKTAKQVVNAYGEQELRDIFKHYGELKQAGAIARTLVSTRTNRPINTTGELKTALERFAPRGKSAKFFAQVFQALRMEVNDEPEALHQLIKQTTEGLKPGGRFCVIAYHSLEDRPVKHFFKSGNFTGKQEKDLYGNILRPLTPIKNKVITPAPEELEENPRARSAKLRIAEKNG